MRHLIWPCWCSAGCLPILLARHMEPDGVLYPLRVLGFEVVALQDWREMPDKLLQLAEDLAANPGVGILPLPWPDRCQSHAVFNAESLAWSLGT